MKEKKQNVFLAEKEGGKAKMRRGERQLSNNNFVMPKKLRDILKKLYYPHLRLPRSFRSSITLSEYSIY